VHARHSAVIKSAGAIWDGRDHEVSGGPFDHGDQVDAAVSADQQVNFPMPQFASVGSAGRAKAERHQIRDPVPAPVDADPAVRAADPASAQLAGSSGRSAPWARLRR